MKQSIILLFILLSNIYTNAQQKGSFFNSAEGKTYGTISIGKQIWMAENLNVSFFRNGDPIAEVKNDDEWDKAIRTGMPAWCYYNNNSGFGNVYGKLYNWFAVNDPRGLAPEGWHIPSDVEWILLTEFLGGEDKAGFKMKSIHFWESGLAKEPEELPIFNNSSGFSADPAGYRCRIGFLNVGGFGCWWTSSEYNTGTAWYRRLSRMNQGMERLSEQKNFGFSVRCVKD